MAKQIIMAIGLALGAAVVGVWLWTTSPIQVDRLSGDPALDYLNAPDRMDGALREDYFEFEGNNIHYVEAGSGEAILFLHGFPSHWFSFARQIEDLSDGYRVIAIDGLGAGRSDAPRRQELYALESMSEHVMALLDHLGVGQVHLVGHDWGAAFAFGLAQRYPERILSVTGLSAPAQEVLIEAIATDSEARERAAYIERLKGANPFLILITGGYRRVWTGAYEPLVNAGHANEPEGALFRAATSDPKRIDAHINWYRANIPTQNQISRSSYWPSKRAPIRMPAQLIWGSNDRVFVPIYAELTAERSSNIRLLELEGVGHWPQFERADIVTEAITALIESAEKSQASE